MTTSGTSTRYIFKAITELKEDQYIKIYDSEVSSHPQLTTFELTKRADRSSLQNLFQKIHVRLSHDIRDDSLSLEEWKGVKTKIAVWYQRRYEKLAWWEKFAEWFASFFAVSEVEQRYKYLAKHLDLRVEGIEKRIQETEECISQWNTCWKKEGKLTPQGLKASYTLFSYYPQTEEEKMAIAKRLTGFQEFMDWQPRVRFSYVDLTEDKIGRFRDYVNDHKENKTVDDQFWSGLAAKINSEIANWKEEKKIKDLIIALKGTYSDRTLSTDKMKEQLEAYEIYKNDSCFIECRTEKVKELELQIEALKKSQEKIKNLLSGEQSEQSKKEVAAELEKGFLEYPVLFDLIWKEESLQSLFSKDLVLKNGVEKTLWRLMWVYCLYNPDFNSGIPRAFCDVMGLGDYSSYHMKNFFENVQKYVSKCKEILKQKRYKGDYGGDEILYPYRLFKTIDEFKQKFPKVEIENFLGFDKLIQRLEKALQTDTKTLIKEGTSVKDEKWNEFSKEWKRKLAVEEGVKKYKGEIDAAKKILETKELTPEGLEACYSLFDLKLSTKILFGFDIEKDIWKTIDNTENKFEISYLVGGLRQLFYYEEDKDFVNDIDQRLKIYGKQDKEFWKQLSKDLPEEIAQKEFDCLVLDLKDFNSRYPKKRKPTGNLIELLKKYETNTPLERTPLLEDEALRDLVISMQKELKHLEDLKKEVKGLVEKMKNQDNSDKDSFKKDLMEKTSQAFLLCPRFAKVLWGWDIWGLTISESDWDWVQVLCNWNLNKETATYLSEILKKLAIELYEKSQKKENAKALQLQLQLAFDALYDIFAVTQIPRDFHLPYWSVGFKSGDYIQYITKINPEEWKDKSETIYKFFDKNYKQEEDKLIEKLFLSPAIREFFEGKDSLKLKDFDYNRYNLSDIKSACEIIEEAQYLCIPEEAMKPFYEQFENNEAGGIEWTPDGGISLNFHGARRPTDFTNLIDLMKYPFIQRNLKDLTLNISLERIDIEELALALSSCENLRNLTVFVTPEHRQLVREIAELIEKHKNKVFPSLNAIINDDTRSFFKDWHNELTKLLQDIRKQLKQHRPKLLLLKKKKV